MPRVPTYDDPQAAPQNLPDARQQAPSHMMQQADIGPGQTIKLGQAMEGMGSELAHEAIARQIQTNEMMGKTYAANLTGAHQAILAGSHGDPGNGVAPTPGYLDLRGQAAVDAYPDTLEKLQAAQVDQASILDNDTQKGMVQSYAQLHTQTALDQATQHFKQQLGVANQAAAFTQIKVNGDAAINTFNSLTDTPTLNFDHDNLQKNSAYQIYLESAHSAAMDLADQHGLIAADEKSAAVRDEFIRRQMSDIYVGAINHLATKNPQAAQAYFAAAGGQLDVQTADNMQKMLTTAIYTQYSRSDGQAAYQAGIAQPADAQPLTIAGLEGKESAVIGAAKAQAEQRRPGDANYSDAVVGEALNKWSTDVQAVRGADYSNMTNVLNYVAKNGAQTQGDLPPELLQTYAKLTPQNALSVQAQFERNKREANGAYTHSDYKLVNDLRQRIYLPDGDPQKLTNPGQLTPYIAYGLNTTDNERLKAEMTGANTPETSVLMKELNVVKTNAGRMFAGNMSAMAIQHPELADEAAYRFGVDLDQKIMDYRKQGKDMRNLFTPGNPDYVLSPNRVMSFMPTVAQIAATKAAATTPGTTNAPRQPGESPADYMKRMGR